MYKIEDKTEILLIAEKCKGKSFGEIDNLNILEEEGNKGALGHAVEMNVFKYDRNSNPNKDFVLAGLELKVTPYRQNKNGSFSAKERLVMNMIDYFKDYDKIFAESSFYEKNQELLLMFYKYEEYASRQDYIITHIMDYIYPETDLIIIKQDYEIIQNKIRQGKAHLISEGDTMYLGACTKGVNAQSLRNQPFSNIKAKQRAYSLKTTYMTQILRKAIKNSTEESIFFYSNLIQNISFEENIRLKINKYFGMSQKELKETFLIRNNLKNLNELLFSRMLGITGKVSNTDEFKKANIIPKTVRLNSNESITESMSFPAFTFEEIYNNAWEDSSIRDYFDSLKILFIIFKWNTTGDLIFEDIKLWNIPTEILDNQIKDVYKSLRNTLLTGKIIKEVDSRGRFLSNFPGMTFNGVCHIRPHARDGNDTYRLPFRDKLTGKENLAKHCFWLNNTFIQTILK